MNIYETILNKTLSTYDISLDRLLSTSRKGLLVEARYAYFLALKILGEDIHSANRLINLREHTMPAYYVAQATEKFKASPLFRERIKIIADNDDKFEQFASEVTPEIVKSIKVHVETKTKVRNDYPRSEHGKKMHSFNFSDREEIAIRNACLKAKRFFKSYGKGYTSDGILMVDVSRYDNIEKPKKIGNKEDEMTPKQKVRYLIRKIKQIQLLKRIKEKQQNEPTATLSATDA